MVKHPRKTHGGAAASAAPVEEEDGGSMDRDEQKVLRRKKNVLANHIQLDDDWVQGLTVNGLINDGMMAQIKVVDVVIVFVRLFVHMLVYVT